jgi:hypothetical protein
LAEGVVLAVAPGPATVGRYLSPLPSVSALVERLLDASRLRPCRPLGDAASR